MARIVVTLLLLTLGACVSPFPCATGFETYVEGGRGYYDAIDVRGGVSIYWDLTGTCGDSNG